MSLSSVTRTSGPARTVLGAFVVQALASLAVWAAVDDRVRGAGSFSNDDVGEWVRLSAVCALLLVVVAGACLRRRAAVAAVAVGCLLAWATGLATFVGWAVLGSA